MIVADDEIAVFAAMREIAEQLALGGLTANEEAALIARRKRMRATYGEPPPQSGRAAERQSGRAICRPTAPSFGRCSARSTKIWEPAT